MRKEGILTRGHRQSSWGDIRTQAEVEGADGQGSAATDLASIAHPATVKVKG